MLYLMGIFRTSCLGGSISSTSERNAPKRQGEESGYIEIFQQRGGSLNIKGKVTQSCLILCDPMDYTVYEILQARILEWVAFSFSRRSSQPRDKTSHIAGGFFTN